MPLDLDDPAHHGRTEAPDGPAAARDALDAAFEQLDADQRAILTLHHLQGRGLAEIAAVLEVPVGTVKSRLHTARRRLEHAIESTSR